MTGVMPCQFITVNEFCSLYGIKSTTAYKYIKENRVKAVKIGNIYRIDNESFKSTIKNFTGNKTCNTIYETEQANTGEGYTKMMTSLYCKPLTANGSIVQRKGNYRLERFPVRYTGKIDKNGKPEREYAPAGKFKTKKEAETYRFNCQKERERYSKISLTNPLVSEYILNYIETDKKPPNCKRDTYESYKRFYVKHFAPEFGKITLKECTRDMLMSFFNRKAYEMDTIHYAFIVKAAFERAVDEHLIESNIAKGIKGSKRITQEGFIVSKEKQPLSDEEDSRLMQFLINEKPPYWYVIILARYTGARIGEILGLTWKDINIEQCYINITKSWGRSSGRLMEKGTKNKGSVRKASFPQVVQKILYNVKDSHPLDTYFAQSSKTRYAVGDNVIRKWLKKYCAKIGIIDRVITPHILRHTYITDYLRNGGNLKDLTAQVGHEDERMIMKVYAHVNNEYLNNTSCISGKAESVKMLYRDGDASVFARNNKSIKDNIIPFTRAI
jgi:excisionase family DNA binding protein